MNVCYTVFGLKHVPILDVSIVALGFVMRILFGSFLTGIPVSSWLLLTVMVASYYMSFGKRRKRCTQISLPMPFFDIAAHDIARHRPRGIERQGDDVLWKKAVEQPVVKTYGCPEREDD